MERTHCDKCGGEIIDKGCPCGEWLPQGHNNQFFHALEAAIQAYNEHCHDLPISGDHFTGTCFVFFKGDYEKSRRVLGFIQHIEEQKEGK